MKWTVLTYPPPLEDYKSVRLLPVLNDINKLLGKNWNIVLKLVQRDCNALADILAKLGVDRNGS